MLLAIVGAFAAAWYLAWRHVRARVLSSKEYELTYEKVEITPPPPWITTDIRPRVFQDASLDPPLSIAGDDLLERVRSAFALHPWVAEVQRVQRLYGGRVKVDLVYRRPVCMVEIAADFIPVDAEGWVLPHDDFSGVEARRYPWLAGIETAPLGPAGTRWGDDRVLGGAEIAAALLADWEKLGLSRIVAVKPSGMSLNEIPTFELVTRRGTRIPWGRGPVAEARGEMPIAEKVAWLEKYLAEHGSLDRQPEGVGLDLSRPAASPSTGSAGPLVPIEPHKVR